MHPPFHRSLALSLALCAMVLRALLPAGWMPNPLPAAGAPAFIICSVDGVHGGGKTDDPAQERTHAPCAFAVAAHLAPPAIAPAALPLPAYAGRAVVAHVAPSLVPFVSFRPQAARAPPSLI